MSVRQDEPFEIQPRANGLMARVLRGSSAVALVLGTIATLLPGPVGRWVAWAAMSVVVAIPLLRVGWLGCRWVVRRDHRFAGIAFALLGVVAVSAGLAVMQGPGS